jgi:Methyltransferase domain
MIELFQAVNWQMTVGERAALAGVLADLRPGVAIEIGTAQGGSLARIAAYVREVHSFDLAAPTGAAAELSQVKWHIGDSHELLPETLRQLEARGVNVEFVLVDGDHTADGVRRDVEDLLASGSIRKTIILLHDTANEEVRRGLEEVPYRSYPKVRAVDLDFVPGYLVKSSPFHHEVWGGLGLIVIDEDGVARARDAPRLRDRVPRVDSPGLLPGPVARSRRAGEWCDQRPPRSRPLEGGYRRAREAPRVDNELQELARYRSAPAHRRRIAASRGASSLSPDGRSNRWSDDDEWRLAPSPAAKDGLLFCVLTRRGLVLRHRRAFHQARISFLCGMRTATENDSSLRPMIC